ncbi:MAG: PAS domain-containing protein [Cytophagales bacterium]|nr:PAS domain-containing protein [Cytophagales bacterium]
MNPIQTIVNASPIPFNIYDKKTNERLFSGKKFEELLGYTADELNAFAKKKMIEIVHPDDLEKSASMDGELNASKEGEHVEKVIRLRHKKGNYLYFQIYCSVYERDESGKMASCLGFATNITEQIELQDKLKQATDVIHQMQYSNSHELRGPVSNIIGLVKMLDSTGFMFEHQRNLVKTLCKTVHQLDKVIHNINDLGNSAQQEPEEPVVV